MKFPVDAPQRRVLSAFALLGFRVVRSGNHISLERKNADGTTTPMTICTQAGIGREDFLHAYEQS